MDIIGQRLRETRRLRSVTSCSSGGTRGSWLLVSDNPDKTVVADAALADDAAVLREVHWTAGTFLWG